MRRLATSALLALGLVLAAPAGSQAATLQPGFEELTVATGLLNGSHVEWAPDGRIFGTSSGKLRVVNPGSTSSTQIHAVAGYIYGMALDKDFASNGYIYLFYAGNDNARLVRISVKPDNTLVNPTNPNTVILGKDALGVCPAPSNTVDCIPNKGSNHVAGTVLSDPRDGTLWVSNGDNASPGFVDTLAFNSQNEQSYSGKILHIDRNGNGLPGHPFCPTDTTLTHICTKVYSKGMRNSYRFTMRSNGDLIVGDTGWETREEVDIIKSGGKNFGWPCYEGTVHTPGYSADTRCAPLYAAEGTSNATVRPIYDYARSSSGSAIIGGPVYTGRSGYPAEYNGNIFFADYVLGYIKRLQLNSSDQVIGVHDFATGAGAVTDVQLAPNGDIVYFDYATGVVKRVRYVSTANRAPTAKAAANPSSGPAPLAVSFSSAGSSDPDGDALSYDWDFGDGSAHSSAANPSHTYNSSGSFTATLKVTDPKGASDTETVAISSGNRAPTVSITAPTTFRDGQTVNLSGSATDPEDGTLGPTTFKWNIRLIHITHEHPIAQPSGVASTSFTTVTDHDADSHYEVTLTATDSKGVTGTKTVRIDPQTVQFALASSPSGAPVTYAAQAHTTPFSTTSAIGFTTSVSAAQSFSTGGKSYEFVSWSDGGARLHDITIPAANTTLTATYREVAGSTAPEDKALGRPATNSWSKGAGFEPSKAVDGSSSTRWASVESEGQWWQVDLGSSRQVDKVSINWHSSYAKLYRILTSTDGVNWSTAAEVAGTGAGVKDTTFTARAARYVRIKSLQRAVTWDGISFWDAKVFGPADVLPPPPPPSGTDLAMNKSALASTSSDCCQPWMANDNNTTTRWRARSLDNQWWRVDLGAATTVGRVQVNWFDSFASRYLIETSTDGVSYTTAADVTTTSPGVKTTTFSPRSARYVRITGVTRGTGTPISIVEAKVFSS